ncbi:J domain-containing protein [Sphingomonas hankookensis]|uniref:J domain-containing protein n=1 Tax=Sphingomonas hankookensis TaxID=563996 RepID=UPI003D3022B6
MRNHYETLGVARDADAATLKSAYRLLAAQHHPDKPGGDQAKFQEIAAAYATLSDPEKRAHYDRTGEDGQRVPSEVEMIAPLVVGAFDRAAEAALKSGPNGFLIPSASKGLGRTDMVASMVKILGEDKVRGEAAVKSIDASVEAMEEMQRRLGFTGEEGSNIIASTLATRLRDAAELKAKNLHTIGLVEKATEHVRLYGWELDPVPEARSTFFDGGRLSESYMREMMRSVFDDMDTLPRMRPIALMPTGEEISSHSSASARAVRQPHASGQPQGAEAAGRSDRSRRHLQPPQHLHPRR